MIAVTQPLGLASARAKRSHSIRSRALRRGRLRLGRCGCARAAVGVVERRVGDDVMKALPFERARTLQNIGDDNLERRGVGVARGIRLREFGKIAVDFHAGDMQSRDARREAQRCNPRAQTQIADALARRGGNCSRQHHRVEARSEIRVPAAKRARDRRGTHRRSLRRLTVRPLDAD